jgi:hypothetical protein
VAFYVIPSIIALKLDHPAKGGIIVVNLVFGMVLVGWVASLAWALNGDHRRYSVKHEHYHKGES